MTDISVELQPIAELQPIVELQPTADKNRYKELFDKYDSNADGKISIEELKKMINDPNFEREFSDEMVEQILNMSDTDNNGELDFDEFVHMMRNPKLKYIFGRYLSDYVGAIIPKSTMRRNRIAMSDEHDGIATSSHRFLYSCRPPAFWMISVSIIEIILFAVNVSQTGSTMMPGPVADVLIYNPRRRYEFWRYYTYMFVHIGTTHVMVNLIVQILLGIPLEMMQSGWRIITLYSCGVIAGALGTSMTDPYVYLAGASGGVYSLITAHIATIIMNWSELPYAWVQLIVFFVITVVDLGTAVYNRHMGLKNNIGYAAHLAGAIAGFLVGIFILINVRQLDWEKKVWWLALILFILFVVVAIIFNIAYPSYFPQQVFDS